MSAPSNGPLKAFLAAVVSRTEVVLDRVLPRVAEPPERLHEAMRYSVLAGGKRLRPAFIVAASELGDRANPLTDYAAAALELIHTYSLVHDDLPAMDDDQLRRGKPTCHVEFDEATAILAGDALLTLSFEVLAAAASPHEVARATLLLARAAGSRGMVGGQMADLQAERDLTTRGADALDFIHRRKTGALFGAATALGGLAAGLDDTEVEHLERFGCCVGRAFQVADDLLDIEGDTTTLGKTTGKDVHAGKLTYPAVHGVDRSRVLAQTMLDEAFGYVEPFGVRAERLRQLANYVTARRH